MKRNVGEPPEQLRRQDALQEALKDVLDSVPSNLSQVTNRIRIGVSALLLRELSRESDSDELNLEKVENLLQQLDPLLPELQQKLQRANRVQQTEVDLVKQLLQQLRGLLKVQQSQILPELQSLVRLFNRPLALLHRLLLLQTAEQQKLAL